MVLKDLPAESTSPLERVNHRNGTHYLENHCTIEKLSMKKLI